MRRGQVIILSALVALIAAALGVMAWRADSTDADRGGAAPTTVPADVTTTIVAESAESVESVGSGVSGESGVSAESGEEVVERQPTPTSASAPSPLPSAVTATSPVDSAPASSTVGTPSVPEAQCPDTPHGAIVDRATQRAWLCDGPTITAGLPITSAWSMPDPGTYPVYAKDLAATSGFGGHFSRMTHFVAFTHGERTGARIAFHSVPTLNDGTFVQTLASVGDLDRRGESSGCIRVLPDDAVLIWDWLSIGDAVHVIS